VSVPLQSPAPQVSSLEAARWRRWQALDRALQWASDRLNPILVKETRQALKSRQFAVTFALLLLCGWAWTILGVARIGPGIWYSEQGPEMFFGYYVILAFPLLVIVPFGAFRSLAVEREDRTYELMSITTLGPRQIVRGKLGSAAVQMLVYLSAISPCLAFTYMLRGIDFPTILFILFWTILASLGLAVVGLFLGTLTQERHWQVVLSVALVAGLLFVFLMDFFLVGRTLSDVSLDFRNADFWQANAMLLTAYATYYLLVFYAAAAQVTFASDNRSTRLRAVMLLQQVLLTGWLTWAWISPTGGHYGVLMIFIAFIGLHWYVMGALMTGESSELSLRVRRHLPQSFLGRALFTWFNPGPGTGYVFALSNLAAALLMVLAAVASAGMLPQSSNWAAGGHVGEILAFATLVLAYATIYLGLGLLLLRLLRKVARVGILLGALIQTLLVLLGTGVPMIVHLMSPQLRGSDYSLLHITNPFWSSLYVSERSPLPPEGHILLVVVPVVALVVFLLNLPGVGREVQQVRIAKPPRVAEEDAQLAAQKTPPQPTRTSPWG
jgi:hypothetical protein